MPEKVNDLKRIDSTPTGLSPTLPSDPMIVCDRIKAAYIDLRYDANTNFDAQYILRMKTGNKLAAEYLTSAELYDAGKYDSQGVASMQFLMSRRISQNIGGQTFTTLYADRWIHRLIESPSVDSNKSVISRISLNIFLDVEAVKNLDTFLRLHPNSGYKIIDPRLQEGWRRYDTVTIGMYEELSDDGKQILIQLSKTHFRHPNPDNPQDDKLIGEQIAPGVRSITGLDLDSEQIYHLIRTLRKFEPELAAGIIEYLKTRTAHSKYDVSAGELIVIQDELEKAGWSVSWKFNTAILIKVSQQSENVTCERMQVRNWYSVNLTGMTDTSTDMLEQIYGNRLPALECIDQDLLGDFINQAEREYEMSVSDVKDERLDISYERAIVDGLINRRDRTLTSLEIMILDFAARTNIFISYNPDPDSSEDRWTDNCMYFGTGLTPSQAYAILLEEVFKKEYCQRTKSNEVPNNVLGEVKNLIGQIVPEAY